MSRYTEFKVVPKTTWYGTEKFEVKRFRYRSGKPPKLLNEVVLFTGSILECEAFIRLKIDDLL